MPTCVAYGCVNRTSKKIPGITFHSFPKESEILQQWTKAVRRKNWYPSSCSRLCSLHFREEDIDRTSLCRVRIREGVVPSIFPASMKPKSKERRVVTHPEIDLDLPVPMQVTATESLPTAQEASSHFASSSKIIMDEIEEELREIHRENELEITGAATEEEIEQMQEEHLIEQPDEEEIPFTYEVLHKYAEAVKLPSSLWATHKDPSQRFVVFSRLPATRTGRLVADKSIVFADSLVPCVFFREMKIKLPNEVEYQPLESLDEVSEYIKKIHRLAFCSGTGLRDPIRSIKCRIYVDMPSTVRRCTACSSQRQSVLFAAQQKT